MKIRKANGDDFEEIWKTLSSAKELQSAEEETYDEEWLKDVLGTGDNLALIAEEKGVLAGFAIVHYLMGVRQAILNDVYVFPEFRGKGIGKKLIAECEEIAKKKKFRNITSLIQLDNEKMQGLSEKLGYRKGIGLYFYEKRF